MSTKLYSIICEILAIKSTYLKKLHPIKVDTHQDKIKTVDSLAFHEKLNIEYNNNAK